jgi:hypothetical protein
MAGLLVVAAVCAAFWTGVVGAVGYLFDSPPSASTLALIATANVV